MALLEMLEGIRSPFLDRIMLIVTEMGGKVFLIAFGLIVLWCTDKRLGRYMLTVGLIGTVLSQWLKILCRVPRPWVRKEGFTIVEAAREGAGGYSFPSGHSQSAAAVFGCSAVWYKNTVVRWLCAALLLLVMFSRMYLGVHTLQDVIVGTLLSLGLILLLSRFFLEDSPKNTRLMLLVSIGVAAVYVLFMLLFPFSADTDPDNLREANKNAWLLLGATAGIFLAYELDERKVHYATRAFWYVQVIKTVLGLGLVLLLRMVLKTPLLSLFGGHPAADAVRYFILCLTAAGLWPMTFRVLARLGKGTEKQP